jgi:hypothetical protein
MLRCESCGAGLAKRPAGERQPTRCARCRGQPQVKPVPKPPPKQRGERPTVQSYGADALAMPKLPWDP